MAPVVRRNAVTQRRAPDVAASERASPHTATRYTAPAATLTAAIASAAVHPCPRSARNTCAVMKRSSGSFQFMVGPPLVRMSIVEAPSP